MAERSDPGAGRKVPEEASDEQVMAQRSRLVGTVRRRRCSRMWARDRSCLWVLGARISPGALDFQEKMGPDLGVRKRSRGPFSGPPDRILGPDSGATNGPDFGRQPPTKRGPAQPGFVRFAGVPRE